MKQTIQIPTFLHEVHGERANPLDVILAHLFAVAVTFLTLYLSLDEGLPLIKLILLGILAYDLSGGVLANFSTGTSRHYAASAKARRNFLLLHILQPSLMIYIYQGNDLVLALLCAFIVLGAALVNAQKEAIKQFRLGSLISLVGLTILFIPATELTNVQTMLLAFFMLKLPLAFAVNWYALSSKKN